MLRDVKCRGEGWYRIVLHCILGFWGTKSTDTLENMLNFQVFPGKKIQLWSTKADSYDATLLPSQSLHRLNAHRSVWELKSHESWYEHNSARLQWSSSAPLIPGFSHFLRRLSCLQEVASIPFHAAQVRTIYPEEMLGSTDLFILLMFIFDLPCWKLWSVISLCYVDK